MALPSPVTVAAARTVLPPVEDVEDDDTLPLQCQRAHVIASEIAGAYNVDSSCWPWYTCHHHLITMRSMKLWV
jgi:hypothetical protein